MSETVLRHSKAAGVDLVLTEDQKFHVRAGDEVIVETKVLSYAEIAYDEAVDERTVNLQERRRREQASFELKAIRTSSVKKATSRRGNGGFGGRGGVSR